MTEQTLNQTWALRDQQHPNCFVCAHEHVFGLRVNYVLRQGGGVKAEVGCPGEWEGYTDCVHGGVIAALLDGAMTNCLFAMGIAAVTADLHVSYRHARCGSRSLSMICSGVRRRGLNKSA